MNLDELLCINKLKEENKLDDGYLNTVIINRYLQLTVEIEGIKISEPILIQKTPDKKSVV